ncbi:MAG: LysR family transcriptional regulator [Caulobacter sp.]|nr:LysR family transcriptional regulator [Caulobacter sp.]
MDTPLLSAGDFNQLRAFVAVAGSLSFSRAAESLGVSSSALSQMVRARRWRKRLARAASAAPPRPASCASIASGRRRTSI